MRDCIVIGAGLAGLACARALHQAGRDVLVLEAWEGVGGRVRSDRVEGFTLDRGFQVLFDRYPAVLRHLDLAALDLRKFDPGAIVCGESRQTILTDPGRDPSGGDIVRAVLSHEFSPADKLAVLKLAAEIQGMSPEQMEELRATSTSDYLRARGLSEKIIERFFVPFYGGIFLDRSLSTDAALFAFYFQMLATGSACLPSRGMGEITTQLADPLMADGRVRLSCRVNAIEKSGELVTGIRAGDDVLSARSYVLATEGIAIGALAGLTVSVDGLGATCVYFAGEKAMSPTRKIFLNAEAGAIVNNMQIVSNIVPEYAPPGKHLLSATLIGIPDLEDSALYRAARSDIARMLQPDKEAARAFAGYRDLAIYRIPFSQYRQSPGAWENRPTNTTAIANLYIASEITESSSINGALTSGEKCAAAVLMGTPSTD